MALHGSREPRPSADGVCYAIKRLCNKATSMVAFSGVQPKRAEAYFSRSNVREAELMQ
jgi:hypothetical protein